MSSRDHSSITREDAIEQLAEMERRLNAFSRWKDTVNDRLAQLEAENEALRARLEDSSSGSQPEKKTIAKQLARNELLRQIDERPDRRSHLSGEDHGVKTASVDVPTVQEQAKGRSRELRYNTVRTALEELAEQWRCFGFREGSGAPTGANNRAVKLKDVDVPERLWTLYREDTAGGGDEEVDAGVTESVVSRNRSGGG